MIKIAIITFERKTRTKDSRYIHYHFKAEIHGIATVYFYTDDNLSGFHPSYISQPDDFLYFGIMLIKEMSTIRKLVEENHLTRISMY